VRSAVSGDNPKGKGLEFRVPDPSANPYLAFSAMMMAGIDGIRNKIEPPDPVDKDLYELPPDEALAIPQVPGSLEKVLDTLEADHDYLLDGGVFTPGLVETLIDYKRSNELDPVRLRPHPDEFELYFDISLLARAGGAGHACFRCMRRIGGRRACPSLAAQLSGLG